MSRNASSTANNSRNACVIARPPAPPVSTSVPSMSKRTTEASESGSAFRADVSCARAFCRRFFLETDPLTFIELVEAALHRASVEEPLLPAIVANETEPSVPNESLDRTGCHRESSPWARSCPRYSYQYLFHARRLQSDLICGRAQG